MPDAPVAHTLEQEIREFFHHEALPNVEIMLQDDGDAYGSTFGLDIDKP
jgi:hypothetical protein